MTQKTNDNTKGNQPNQGINANKQTQGKGAQAGGKSSPAGGPETFESDQVNQGKSVNKPTSPTSQGGSQSGRGDPYPPVNPDRPMMAGGQQGGKPIQTGTQANPQRQGGQGYSGSPGQTYNAPSQGSQGFGGAEAGQGKAGIGTVGGEEEE